MHKPILILLHGVSGAGKDTLAGAVRRVFREHGGTCIVRAFSDPVRRATAQIYGWAGMKGPDYYRHPAHHAEKHEVLPAVGKTPTQLTMAVSPMGRAIHVDTWLMPTMRFYHRLMERDQKPYALLMTDTRFLNEWCWGCSTPHAVFIKVARPHNPVPLQAMDSEPDLREFIERSPKPYDLEWVNAGPGEMVNIDAENFVRAQLLPIVMDRHAQQEKNP